MFDFVNLEPFPPIPFTSTVPEEDLPSPVEIVSDLGVGIVMVALVSMLQHMANAKFYCRKEGVRTLNKF